MTILSGPETGDSSRNDVSYACLIGAQKAGTTSLFHYMSTHPEIHTVWWKEGKLFLHDPPLSEDIDRFNRLSEGIRPGQVLFETSTYYTKFPRYSGVAERISKVFPKSRFLYLVREPVERIWSQYRDYLSRGHEWRSFSEAVRENPDYLNFSRYWLQLSQYLQEHSDARIKVVVLEEFLSNREATLRDIFQFLQIDPDFVPTNLDVRFNESSGKRRMVATRRWLSSVPGYRHLPWRFRNWMKYRVGPALPQKDGVLTTELRAQLQDELRDDVERLFEFLGRRIMAWPEFSASRTTGESQECGSHRLANESVLS